LRIESGFVCRRATLDVASRTYSSSPYRRKRGRMEGSDNKTALRAARNQSLFRKVNERVAEVNEAFRLVLEDAEFICECADDECMERISLTLDEYKDVRRSPTHFFVMHGHVYPEFERVIAENGMHVVVEKFGAAGKAAVEAALATLPR
jgi:hypothetical protein